MIGNRENDIKLRLKTLLASHKTNVHQIAEGDNAWENKISRQLRDTSMTVETLLFILDKFPDTNLEWLIMGKGDIEPQAEYDTSDNMKTKVSEDGIGTIEILRDQLRIKDEQIDHLLQVLTSINKNKY